MNRALLPGCASRGLEVGPSPSLIRLEMIPFGPLIPGIHEDEVLFGAEWSEPTHGFGQPVLVTCWRASDPDSSAPRLSWCIVPPGCHARVPLVWRCRRGEGRLDEIRVSINAVTELSADWSA